MVYTIVLLCLSFVAAVLQHAMSLVILFAAKKKYVTYIFCVDFVPVHSIYTSSMCYDAKCPGLKGLENGYPTTHNWDWPYIQMSQSKSLYYKPIYVKILDSMKH